MSWIKEDCISFFQMFCIKIIKTGRIPQHIAYIMDGNRRFAKKNSVDYREGHRRGFDKLSENINWWLITGIQEVTVYAYSIENFKRSKEEVDALMDLARDKFQNLLENLDKINEWGVRVHIAGRLSLLPDDIKTLASKVILYTRHNNKLRLNIAFAYTGRDEISRAASRLVDGVKNYEISSQDIDVDLISRTLELRAAELLIRSSGEVRLSDFMLWQVSNSVLYFTDNLWPELSIWNFLTAIIHFQRYAPPQRQKQKLSKRKLKFLDKLENERLKIIEKYVSSTS